MLNKHFLYVIWVIILLVIAGCNDDDDDDENFEAFTPFERVATIPAVSDAAGQVDEKATYARVKDVTKSIARYIATNVESETIGADIKGGDWVVAGLETQPTAISFEDDLSSAILAIPSQQSIDSSKPFSATNMKTVQVVEICNRTYAGQALGAKLVTDSVTVDNGLIHATALPCEIAVHNEDGQIQVNMLDPNAIFRLFFTDVLFGLQMNDADFSEAMTKLPSQVKKEIRAIIIAALETWRSQSGINFTVVQEPIGPTYRSNEDITNSIKNTPEKSPYLHYVYTKQDGGIFTSDEVKHIAQTVVNTLTIHGEPNAGKQEAALLALLSSPDASWRSARHAPLTMPGGNQVVESCSPHYAKMAIGTAYLDHATALPCEISFNTIDGGQKLLVSFLSPNYMFGALFADMSDAEKAAFANVPNDVLNDLRHIVDYALTKKLDVTLNPKQQVTYDMLLGH
ncbi:hypothetical protein PN36_02965 [Candidatus Thiomargarita nelsonii]|uniref:Lipoprotein n=1 Tax=Candidatus Thiomargarita nelsonii TaxID=1003181 RepID=A0A0A6PFX4_9GAMM|nr:hypothetical protein PN36_02965 [Candidatus Thiomargarita nelsonii]